MTEKGLDLVPMLFEMILWSARYDSKSEARHITQLIEMIRKNNRRISGNVIDQIRNGESLFPKYLDKTLKGVSHA